MKPANARYRTRKRQARRQRGSRQEPDPRDQLHHADAAREDVGPAGRPAAYIARAVGSGRTNLTAPEATSRPAATNDTTAMR